jgi:hypothetical protein
MARRGLTHDEIMPILRTSVARLGELTDGLTDAQLHARPGLIEWSINDVYSATYDGDWLASHEGAHLRHLVKTSPARPTAVEG